MTYAIGNIPVHETGWTVEGLRIAGLCFGPDTGTPILALHGWLDNASSFAKLAQFLPGRRLVALDMPGHGLSDHRSADAGYQIWDDLPQLVGIIDQLGWEECVLMGHSRGAMIASLMASVIPERVSALITLDGMLPYPADDGMMVEQLRNYLNDRRKQAQKSTRLFASHADFVERRGRSGEPRVVAEQLAERNLRKTDNAYEWRGDPRLSGASAMKLNLRQCEAMLKALSMPVLNIWATPSERLKKLMEAARALAQQHVLDLTSVEVAGHHHWHMEEPTARKIAKVIEGFLESRRH